jgi:hypothetical protein
MTNFHHIGYPLYYRDILESVPFLNVGKYPWGIYLWADFCFDKNK